MLDIERQLASLSPAKRALLERKRKAQASLGIPRSSTPHEGAPLSFAQQRLWLLQELNPTSYSYNVPRGLRLQGPLDVGALERALNEIVRRHQTLRTSFPAAGEDPVQKIEPIFELSLPVHYCGAADILHEAEALYRIPFNLTTGPVLRAKLWKIAPDHHVLMVVMHHIVSDAWTGSILFEELSALYGAFVTGRPSPLPELPIQYADYAAWQRETLSGERLRHELGYWERHLDGAPGFIDLPVDRPRSGTERFGGALEAIPLPAELSDRLSQLGRAEGATLFMTLLAGFSLLLSRYASQQDLVIGTDLANRTQVETEKLIGFFINVLPVRTQPIPSLTFRELLSRVREAALGAYAHQEIPFDRIVEAVKPERSLSHNPLVQVLFVMQNTPARIANLAGLETTEFRLPMTTARFDLGVFVEETPQALVASWLYSTDLFDRSTILRMARHFETLLASACAAPDVPIGELAMLTAEEERQKQAENEKARRSKSRRLMMTVPEAVQIPAPAPSAD